MSDFQIPCISWVRGTCSSITATSGHIITMCLPELFLETIFNPLGIKKKLKKMLIWLYRHQVVFTPFTLRLLWMMEACNLSITGIQIMMTLNSHRNSVVHQLQILPAVALVGCCISSEGKKGYSSWMHEACDFNPNRINNPQPS